MKHLFKKLKSGLMILMAVIMSLPLSSLSVLAAEPASSVQNPGIKYVNVPGTDEKIELHKTASPTKNAENKDMVNQWDITLKVVAPKSAQKVDTILVIDRSGSMSGTKMTNAKKAAKDLIDRLLDDENVGTNRVAVVSFAGDVTTNQDFTNNAALAKEAIESLNATGGTHTQAGMRQARILMGGSLEADIKNIVLLSDGQPTYSYALSNPDDYLIEYGTVNFETSANAPANAYLTDNRVGTGNSLRQRYGESQSMVESVNGEYFTTTETLYIRFLGSYSKRNPDRTIGGMAYYKTNRTYYLKVGNDYIKYTQPATKYNLVTHDHYYNNGNSAIAEAGYFKNGSQQNVLYTIALDAGEEGTPILNAMASDGKAFEATPESLEGVFADITGKINSTVQNASVEDIMGPGVVIDPASVAGIEGVGVDGNKLTWDIETLKYDKQLKKYIAELTYRVEATQAIVGADNDNGFYPANQKAEISYNNEKGEPQPKVEFLIPKINPVFVNITKTLKDDDGSCANCEFTFTSNRGDEFKVKADETKIFVPVVAVGAYILTETEVDGNATALNQFTVTPDKFEGVLTQTCDDLEATFTNTLKRRSVNVEKKWVGKKADSVTVNLLADKVKVNEIVLNESKSWKHTFHNLRQYDVNGKEIQYTISENPLDEDERYEDPVYTGSMDDTLFVTNTYTPKPISITGYKKWVNGENFDGGRRPDIQLQLKQNGKNHGSPVTLTGGETPQTSHTWDNLDETDINGKKHVYTVDEVAVPDSYEKTFENNNLTVVNTYKSQNTTVTVTKKWKGGSVLKPASIKVNIYRQIEGGVVELALGNEEITDELGDNWTKTWQLPATDDQGNEYTYSVEEIKIANFTPSYEGLEITNTYNSEVRKVTANKEWVNGPSEHPPIWFQLYRQIKGGTPEIVPNANIRKVTGKTTTWSNIAKTDDEGRPYTFSVKEVDKDGNAFTPANYTKAENGLTVTNTYQSPKINITGTKAWVHGEQHNNGIRPDVQLQLNQDGAKYQDSENPDLVNPVTIKDGTLSYTWENIPETDINGKKHIYTIDEVEVPENYNKTISEDGLTITNTYTPKLVDLTVKKEWKYGELLRPDAIIVDLYRDDVLQPGMHRTLSAISWMATWDDLPETDISGNSYAYTVKERPIINFNLTNTHTSDDGLVITLENTFESPTISVTGTKKWVNGPSTKPIVWLRLVMLGENHGCASEAVGITTSAGESSASYTWSGWKKYQRDGQLYTYKVEELDAAEGNVLNSGDMFGDYEVSYSADGLTVTNTYVQPMTDVEIVGTKEWVDGDADNRPTIEFELWRKNGTAGEGEKVVDATIVTEDKVNFGKQLKTDTNGVEYEYYVKEVGMPANYNKNEIGLTVVNTYIVPTQNITVKKVWVGGHATEVEVELIRDGDQIATAKLNAGNNWQHTWEEMPLTDEDGESYVYAVRELTRLSSFRTTLGGSLEDGFIVTNCWLEPGKGMAPKTGTGTTVNPLIMLFALFLVALGIRGRKLAKQTA